MLALSTWPGMFLESQDRFLAEKRREMWRVPTGEQIDNVIQDIAQGFRINPKNTRLSVCQLSPIMFCGWILGEQVVKCEARSNI